MLVKIFGTILKIFKLVREAGLEPARPKTQVPKTCVSAISPLPQTFPKERNKSLHPIAWGSL